MKPIVIEGVRNINLIIGVAGMVISVLGLMQVLSSRYLEKKTRNFLITFFAVLAGYVASNLLGQVSDEKCSLIWAIYSRVTLFFESFLASILAVLTTGFLLFQCEVDHWYKRRTFYVPIGLWGFYVLLLIYTQFTGVLYSIDQHNVYHRGPFYPLLLIPTILIMIFNLAVMWFHRNKLSSRQRIAFRIYIIFPLISMLLQMFFYGLYVIILGSSLAALFMFTYIITDQTERFYVKEAENAKLKIDILLAQIQPHFLYNSLTNIKYICRKDPAKAEKAITEFTTYLRHNMDSLTMDRPIKFENELKHIKAYLALQTLRFGDDLNVQYDLECTDFRIPTLTLQPLVENAVSYGIRKSSSGEGVVTVRSRRYPDRVEVSVEDDGPGFVYNTLPDDEDRSHIGLKNVKERLHRVCGGDLKVDSVIGKGTKVTMILPREEKYADLRDRR